MLVKEVNWNNQYDYEKVLEQAKAENKPILLDLHSISCQGCNRLESDVFSNEEVLSLIGDSVIPLRVMTDNPDEKSRSIINNHIFVWSSTVQLLSPNGDRFHEFNGAPRQTRHSVGYDKTHHELDGNLDAGRFISQLKIGLGKALLRKGAFKEAASMYKSVIEHSNVADELGLTEAKRWLDVANSSGAMDVTFARTPTENMSPFAATIEKFADTVSRVRDRNVMDDWKGQFPDSDWRWYTDCLREVVFQTYQNLCSFANELDEARINNGTAQNQAQRILNLHHKSYRDFQSHFVGMPDSLLDKVPLLGQRSLRENIVHCMLTEWWAHGPQIRHSIYQKRTGQEPSKINSDSIMTEFGEPIQNFETTAELFGRFEELHNKTVAEFSTITDEEINTRSVWWEPSPVTVKFRLDRLGWHLRDHTVSVEHLLNLLEHKPSVTQRFAKLLYSGLGIAEASMIGAELSDEFKQKQSALIEEVTRYTRDIEKMISA